MKGLTERQIRRRETILSAARTLISKHGFDGVTIRDLARESNVAPKTLYHQFGNKENLLRTAVEERFRYIYQMIDEANINRGVDRLFHIVDSVTNTTRENAAYARALAPLLSQEDTTFSLIRMKTYGRAVTQIADEGELLDWVDAGVLKQLIFRQVNPIFVHSRQPKTAGKLAAQVVKLDIALILGSMTKGYTHRVAMTVAKQTQAELCQQGYE